MYYIHTYIYIYIYVKHSNVESNVTQIHELNITYIYKFM